MRSCTDDTVVHLSVNTHASLFESESLRESGDMVWRTVLPALLLFTCSAAATPGQSAYLDVQKRFYIEWDYDDTNITILARVKTTGWFGIGFSPNGGMAGADIITAGVRDGVPYLQDRNAERNGYPVPDKSQDVHLLYGSEINGETTIKFTRKHSTCDDKDLVVAEDTMRIIYAISADGSDDLSYHRANNRGTRSLYLRRKLADSPKLPDDAFTVDMIAKNTDVKPVDTRYFCQLIRAPKLDGKHHMIKVEPVISKESLGVVHHMILYGCYGVSKSSTEALFKQGNTGHECYRSNMPRDLRKCFVPVAVWAVGGGDLNYPAEAGFAMGKGVSPDYYFLEIHYDNPGHVTGLKDSSGLRLTLTKTLRANDAAVLQAGSVRGISVPPKEKDFVYNGFCTSACTKAIAKKPMKIFGSSLHGHLAARQMMARQFRNGRELAVIDADRNYDFNYQQYKLVEKPIDFLPGDDIMITCHYNTEDRTTMTYGGNPTTSEMCLGFLFYYPAQPFSKCMSIPGFAYKSPDVKDFVTNKLGFPPQNRQYTQQLAFNLITKHKKWTSERVKTLEQAHLTYKQYEKCERIDDTDAVKKGTSYLAPTAALLAPRLGSNQCKAKSDAVIG